MKQTWCVAKLTFKMLVTRGRGWLLLLFIGIVTGGLFGICQADGVLAHELQLRSRYALGMGTSLVGICLLWMACVSMRGDIESKRMHLLTAYPLRRGEIFAGKWLGLMGFGLLGAAMVMSVVGLSCEAMLRGWGDPGEAAAVRAAGGRVLTQVVPTFVEVEAEVERRLEEQLRDRTRPPEETLQHWREQLRDQVRRDQQLLQPNAEKRYRFELGGVPRHEDRLQIRYRFYTSDRRSRVKLAWSIRGTTTSRTFEATTADFPFSTHTLEVPVEVVPPDGRLEVTIRGEGNPELVIYRGTGMRILYRDQTLAWNCVKFLGAVLAHYGAIVTVGLTIGIAFTISVASFVAGVLYFLAVTSSFFQGFLRELGTESGGGVVDVGTRLVIRLGTFFTTGLEPPAVVAALADSMAITSGNLGMSVTRWFGGVLAFPVRVLGGTGWSASGMDVYLGFLVYVGLVTALGMWLLTRKELDRVH